MRKSSLQILALLSFLLPALPALAYLDPASGSMILQLLLGGIAGVALAVKLYWQKLLGIFRKKQEHDEPAA